jgi:hypothetical protein
MAFASIAALFFARVSSSVEASLGERARLVICVHTRKKKAALKTKEETKKTKQKATPQPLEL